MATREAAPTEKRKTLKPKKRSDPSKRVESNRTFRYRNLKHPQAPEPLSKVQETKEKGKKEEYSETHRANGTGG